MIKKLVGLVVIVVLLAAAVAAFGSSDTKDSNPISSINQQNVALKTNNSNISNYKTTKSSQTNLSPAEAQKIANKYIQEPGAAAGTPKLMKQNGQMVYFVPVSINGKQVGEIYIDAQTGRNLGGGGGAP
jgi:uncharacterized membrane protein YkoI